MAAQQDCEKVQTFLDTSKKKIKQLKFNRYMPYTPMNDTINNKKEVDKKKVDNSAVMQKTKIQRFLARKYTLTATGYKYLEIGIVIHNGSSDVEIAIGDTFGNEIIMNIDNWRKLYEYRTEIEDYFKSNDCNELTSKFLTPQIQLKFTTFQNNKVINIRANNTGLVLMHPTVTTMFNLDACVEANFKFLTPASVRIDKKLENLKYGNFNSDYYTVYDSDSDYNINNLIDSELYELYLSKIN